MDVISMQVANKALKKLNTEYGGFCYSVTATQGQTVVTSQKAFDKEGHSLRVHVDGIRAVKDRDYSITDNKTLEFVEPLRAGDVVTLSTDIAGVPKYTIMYDDTEIKKEVTEIKGDVAELNESMTEAKSDITKAKEDILTSKESIETAQADIVAAGVEIEAIKNALDEDGDGSIVDTIADIKKQWADADEALKLLIENKATREEIEALKTGKASVSSVHSLEIRAHDTEVRVELVRSQIKEIFSKIDKVNESIDAKASVEVVAAVSAEVEKNADSIVDNAKDIATVSDLVSVLAKKNLSDFTVKDDFNGRRYCLSLVNGAIVPVLSHEVMEINSDIPERFLVNEPKEFTISTVANQDKGMMVKAFFTIPNGAIVEYFDADSNEWYRLEDFFGPVETGFPLGDVTTRFRATFTIDGDIKVSVAFKRVDNSFKLQEKEMTFKVAIKATDIGPSEPIIPPDENIDDGFSVDHDISGIMPELPPVGNGDGETEGEIK